MEETWKKGKFSRGQRQNKRKRMTSGATSSTSTSDMNDESLMASAELFVTTEKTESADTSDGVNPGNFWNFLRENCGAVVQQILSCREWQDSMQAHEDSIMALSEENRDLKRKLAIAEGTITRCETAIKRLEDKVTDLTTRSMRDNLVIKNIEEQEQEKNTDIDEKLRQTFKNELNIPDEEMQRISIERAHRVGKYTGGRTRNIVAKLNSAGKSIVMRHLKNLNKTSSVKINEQYPPEVHAKREKLWPLFTEAKRQGKKAKWNIDRLQIDGRTHNSPIDSNKNINLDTVEEALKLNVKHTAVTAKNGGHFQGHTVQIDSPDQVVPAMKAMYSHSHIAGASHVSYAYRTGREGYHISNWEDDGEWGSGKRIMEAITNTDSYNILVCVTGWYGGHLMGPSRFDVIKDLANEAIQVSKFP
jgi:hypothetical protein